MNNKEKEGQDGQCDQNPDDKKKSLPKSTVNDEKKQEEKKFKHSSTKSVPIKTYTVKLSDDSDLFNDNQSIPQIPTFDRSKSTSNLNDIKKKKEKTHHTSQSSSLRHDKDFFTRLHSEESATPITNMSQFSNSSDSIEIKNESQNSAVNIFTHYLNSKKNNKKDNKNNNIISLTLMTSRLSMMLFFFGHFIASQPYNRSMSQYAYHPAEWTKITVGIIFILFMLAAFICIRQCYKNKPKQINGHRKNFKRYMIMSALIMILCAESLIMIQCFYSNFVLKFLTPIFFGLSCLFFMAEYFLSNKNSFMKIVFFLLYCTAILGTLALLLDTFKKIPVFIGSNRWSKIVFPAILAISLFTSASIICVYLIYHCCQHKSRFKDDYSEHIKSNENILYQESAHQDYR